MEKSIDNSELGLEMSLWFDELRDEGENIGALCRNFECDFELPRCPCDLQLNFIKLEWTLIILLLGGTIILLEFNYLKPRGSAQWLK